MTALNVRTMRSLAAVAVSIGVLIPISACSTTSDPPTGPSVTASVNDAHNQQDVTFATQLIDLSEQLIDVANVLQAQTDKLAVQKVLTELTRTAGERIALANSWLQAWGEAPADIPPAPGLLADAQFNALLDDSGPQLRSSIETAVRIQTDGIKSVCATEMEDGENSTAIDYARQLNDNVSDELGILESQGIGQ